MVLVTVIGGDNSHGLSWLKTSVQPRMVCLQRAKLSEGHSGGWLVGGHTRGADEGGLNGRIEGTEIQICALLVLMKRREFKRDYKVLRGNCSV